MIKFNGSLIINEEVEHCTHGNSSYRELNVLAIRSTDELIISEIYDEDGNKRAMVLSGNQAKQLKDFLDEHLE